MTTFLKDSKKKVIYGNDGEGDSRLSSSERSTNSVVKQMEEEWPQMTKEFKRLQREQYELFLHKQHDYGPGNISVGTQLITKEEVHLSLTGLWFRMNDKIQRLKQLVLMNEEPKVKTESVKDTFQDLSIYGIIAQIVKNKKWK